MKTMIKKSHSYDQFQLNAISNVACDRIEDLLRVLDIHDYKIMDRMVSLSCPIHGGDNESAFNLYHQGDDYRGNWKCRTHQCESIFRSSLIGFVRGCLSHTKYGWRQPGDPVVSFAESIDFIIKFTDQNINDIKISKKQKEKDSFVNTIKVLSAPENKPNRTITRAIIQKTLNIPSPYFLNRNFSSEILTKYDVGDCLSNNKEMSGRAVVPIYDYDNEFMIGCSGRSIDGIMPKWKHSDGFKAEECLYNYWYAKDFIKKTSVVVLVESPGNVWRLEEAGIHNSVALFGASLKDKQKILLDISGAMTIITLMDNDEAGKKASEQINLKCNKTYNIINIPIDYPDVAEMTVEQIKKDILPVIERHSI
jgi:hypothetical protein